MHKYIFHKIMGSLFTGILFISIVSCERGPEKPVLSEETLILNNWIWEGMNDLYLWENYLEDLDPEYQTDPEEYFYELLYEEDRFSWIVDDFEALLANFDGVELTTGISTAVYILDDTDWLRVVEYVTPGSPGDKAGIKRGDIIYAVNGTKFDEANIHGLFYQITATLEFADYRDGTIIPNGRKETVTAINLNQNPVLHSEVIDYQDTKIGYLAYSQFTGGQNDEWLNELNTVFENFNENGAREVIIDLRYNRGGYLSISAHIASTLVPRSVMEKRETYVRLVYNDILDKYYRESDLDNDGKPDGGDSQRLSVKLPGSAFNMNLSRVYFLTTGLSASASESLMIGLYPYMEVIQIGDTTTGKFYGSWTVEDWEEPKRHNWAMQPLVFKYANANGFTDFKEGLIPDYLMEENLLTTADFGSLSEPFLAKALELITGVAPKAKKSIPASSNFRTIPEPHDQISEVDVDWDALRAIREQAGK